MLYSIRFAVDGLISVDEVTDMEAGPGLVERNGGLFGRDHRRAVPSACRPERTARYGYETTANAHPVAVAPLSSSTQPKSAGWVAPSWRVFESPIRTPAVVVAILDRRRDRHPLAFHPSLIQRARVGDV